MSNQNNQNRPHQQNNRQQQPNRPQVTQPQNTVSLTVDEKSVVVGISDADEGKVFNNLFMKDMTFEAESLNITEEESVDFEGMISNVLSDMLRGRIGSREAKATMLQWLTDNPDYTREQASEAINTLRGAVETVVQEIPRMLIR